jgi:hypothetical protein
LYSKVAKLDQTISSHADSPGKSLIAPAKAHIERLEKRSMSDEFLKCDTNEKANVFVCVWGRLANRGKLLPSTFSFCLLLDLRHQIPHVASGTPVITPDALEQHNCTKVSAIPWYCLDPIPRCSQYLCLIVSIPQIWFHRVSRNAYLGAGSNRQVRE